MFKHYFKTAWRSLRRNKIYAIINIVGLAIGLACFLIIALYVLDELSYDKFNKNASRIYRINTDIRFGGSNMHSSESADMMGQILKKDYPQVEQYARIYNSSGYKLIKKNDRFIKEENVAYVDSTFFDVFTFPAIAGDTRTALDEPNAVVITESTAKKYFGSANAIGKNILVSNNNKEDAYKITSVIKDMPKNSHFNFDFLFSMKSLNYQWGQYTSHNFHTYLLLAKGTDYKAFEKKFDDYTVRYVLPYIQQFIKINSMDEFKKAGNKLAYSLIPLTKIHLYSDYQYELSPGGNIQYVYIFTAVALFILLIACVNFTNLTTARSANRAKEVGVRKALGSKRKELIIQFLSESILTVCISLLIAIGIVWLILPFFNSIANKSIFIGKLFVPLFLFLLFVLAVVVGLIAGCYPAFFLSSFKPVEVLKGKLKMSGKTGLRSALVVFQFATSIFLIIGTIVIYRQLHFIQTKDIGFNKDQVLIINDAYSLDKSAKVFKDDIAKLSGVQSATISSFLPVSSSARSDNSWFTEPTADMKNGFDIQDWTIDEDYIPTMGMQIIQGRNFSRDFLTDSSAVIINEAAEKMLGRKDPLNTKIYGLENDDLKPVGFNIIGVVKNFNFESLHQNVGPVCLRLNKSGGGFVAFKVNTANAGNILNAAENEWKTLVPSMPFSYRFLDESFNEMYDAEQRVGKLALIFSSLAIAIACLGLFGLATFIAEQRTKEIGIRKVLGASVSNIVQMLSKDFIKLVTIAFIIAVPIGWYFMHKWLQAFAYRIGISWWIFAIAGIIAIIIAFATISIQTIKAARANPVKSLKTE